MDKQNLLNMRIIYLKYFSVFFILTLILFNGLLCHAEQTAQDDCDDSAFYSASSLLSGFKIIISAAPFLNLPELNNQIFNSLQNYSYKSTNYFLSVVKIE